MPASRLIALLAVALAAAVAAGCGGDDADGASAKGSACPDGRVRFGVEPYEDPAKLRPAYEVLAAALQRRLGCPVQLQVVEDYSAEVLAMRNGQLDIAQFGPLGFVFASQRAKAQPLVSFADDAGKLHTYQAGIWVPKDSPIRTLADLKGRSLALSEPGSTSGDALPRYAIERAGMDAKRDVKLDYAGGHPEALLALTNGKVDAAEINTQQLATAKSEGHFDEAKFRRMWVSAPIATDPITVRGDLDSGFKDQVRRALIELRPRDVAKVGAFLDIDPPGPMIPVSKDTYRPIFELARALGLSEKDV